MKIHQLFEMGAVAEFFGKDRFLRVYPVFAIDKAKFSFVEKGKKGAGFDVYIDLDDFGELCEDIVRGRFDSKIAAETSQYPSTYKYVAGENGAKSVAIGKSSKGPEFATIQGQALVNEEKKMALLPVYVKDLRIMAKWFLRITGRIDVKRYDAEMVDFFWESSKKNAASFNKYNEKEDGAYYGDQETETTQAAPAPAQHTAPAPQPAKPTERKTGVFVTTGDKIQTNGKISRIEGVVEGNTEKTFLYITEDGMQTIPEKQYRQLEALVQSKQVKIKVIYETAFRDGIKFVKFAS